MLIGLAFFTSAFFPILKFQFQYASGFSQLINPLSSKSTNLSQNILGSVDYTQISNWFVTDPSNSNNQLFSNSNNLTYLLSIPKLKIKDAVVTVGSMDLKKSLIQYPQTALPGQLGNAVIFGHSVLPQFFNSKSYLTIFSTLYKLEQGDEILINYDNVEYKYIVDEMFEVKPTDLSVLEQSFDQKSLTLITCSPPGTVLRRLIIKASLSLN
jgi:sortase A